MAFCRNCGSKITEGTKFCENCGSPMEEKKTAATPVQEIPASGMDRYGKLFGIILMIMAFVDFLTDPAALTILLSVVIIAGCIFCLGKKYKLKGFTIVALILAIICLLGGISQAKKVGLFKMPGSEAVSEDIVEAEADYEKQMKDAEEEFEKQMKEAEEALAAEEKALDEEMKKSVKEAMGSDDISANTEDDAKDDADASQEAEDEEKTSGEKEKINGVDPDLKAFLDSYEAFMDEYVDFMKKYQSDPNNMISMLSEYADIMERYEDFAEKIDKYDEDEMSKEDAKYYLEVLNRCNQKLLDIY